MTEPMDLRAADADREKVVRALSEQMSLGRLSTVEFDERVRQVYSSRTYGELAPITADLPLPAPLVRPPGTPSTTTAEHSTPGYPHPVDPAEVARRRQQPQAQPVAGEVVGQRQPHWHWWGAGLGGYLGVVIVLVVVWALSGMGYFWPGWFIAFGLFSGFGVFGRGRERRGRCG